MRRLDRRGAIAFVDIADPGTEPSCPVSRDALLARFHAQAPNKPIVSGAAAFAAMWRAIPLLAPIGHLARVPPVMWLVERAYRAFLKLRPWLQRRLSSSARPPADA